MKPTLPEDRELEDSAAQVSERYRAGAQDEPPAKLDAAIRAAAHREVEQPKLRRTWQMPASIAAMLVIGVSLVLLVRDNEPPLSSLDHPAAEEAKLAKPAPPQLAMKSQPKAKADFYREDRPSRERSARPDREPAARDEAAPARDNAMSGASPQSAAPPPAPATAAPEMPLEQEKLTTAEASMASKKAVPPASADAAVESRGNVQALRKQEQTAAVPLQPNDWVKKIDGLLRDGKEADAREQLLGFRKQFPQYPLPERLQALLPPDQH
jgi:hypothetical protein